MKKTFISIVTVISMTLMQSCGTLLGGGTGTTTGSTGGLGDILGGVLGGITGSGTTGGLLDLVIGAVSLNQSSLVGNWHYSSPGCAFTSENLLAKAGGAAAAGNIKEKLAPTYQAIGINSNNTQFVFDENNNFSAKINGIPLSGTYTFDPSTSKIKLQTMLMSISGNVTRTSNGIGLMFESKKLLTVLQTLGKVSGNSTLNTIGELSKNFDGVRLGFDLAK